MASSSKLGASSHGEEEVSQQVRLDLQSPSLEAWKELKLGGEQGLKAAIYYTVTKIVQEEEIKTGATCSAAFIAALTEMVWSQAETIAWDMQAFAKHRGSWDIRTDEVLLLSRRNTALKQALEDEATKENLNLPGTKTKPRPKPVPASASTSKQKKK